MKSKLLTEDQRRLMGISSGEFGGLPAMFQRGRYEALLVEEPESDEARDEPETAEESDT